MRRISSVLAGGFVKLIPALLNFKRLTIFSNKELCRELRSSLLLEIRGLMIVVMATLESILLQAILMLQGWGAPICNWTLGLTAVSLYGQIRMIHSAAQMAQVVVVVSATRLGNHRGKQVPACKMGNAKFQMYLQMLIPWRDMQRIVQSQMQVVHQLAGLLLVVRVRLRHYGQVAWHWSINTCNRKVKLS